MAAQNKQIKKLNVGNFLGFLQDAETKGAQHILEVKDGKIFTKILPLQSKEFIKYVSADLVGIGGDWSDFKDGSYRFYMADLDKIIKAFDIAKHMKKDVVNVKVSVVAVENEDYIRIDRWWLEGQLKLQISAKDGAFSFNYLTDGRWADMNAAPTIAEFDLDSDDIAGLKKIFSYLTIEDNKSGKEQGLHVHLTKTKEGQPQIKFTEDDEKLFTMEHDKNVIYHQEITTTHLSFHAYILGLLNQSLYRIHIKQFGEVQILVAQPSGDMPRTIVIPLTDQTSAAK